MIAQLLVITLSVNKQARWLRGLFVLDRYGAETPPLVLTCVVVDLTVCAFAAGMVIELLPSAGLK
jgi:hypothetical protein